MLFRSSDVKCITITEPDQLICALNCENHPLCHGDCTGYLEPLIFGGTAPFTYQWSTGSTDEEIEDLCAGFYCVTITDANGCTCEACQVIHEPSQLLVDASGVSTLCAGSCNGTASVVASGGTPDYTYSWSNGSTEITLSGLCTGRYYVTVTDANGCTGIDSVDIDQPQVLQCNAEGSYLLCYGNCNGTVNLTVTGGTSPFTYNWNNGTTTEDLSGLCIGLYCVTVTDANGCTTSCCAYVTQPTQLEASAISTNVSCHSYCNGTTSASATGGTSPYSYAWSNGSTNSAKIGRAHV